MKFSTLMPSLGHVLARAVLDVHHMEPELVRLVDLPGQTEYFPVRNIKGIQTTHSDICLNHLNFNNQVRDNQSSFRYFS